MPRTYVNYIVNIFIIVIITQLLLVIIFNSKFCNQVDGVAMGSPLAAILANIFMAFFYDSKWFNEYIFNKPNFYLRYVEDILAAFDKEQNSLNFLDFSNKRHCKIKSTLEKQVTCFNM